MKQKVLTLLKPMLASKGFSKEELEGLATIAAANLSEASTDEDVNNAVSGVVPYADMMQRVSNRMVSTVEAKYKGWVDPTKIGETKSTEVVEQKPSLSMEDIQKLIADRVSEGIEAGLRPIREKEEKQRLQTILYAHEKVKSVPEAFRRNYTLDNEDNLEVVASQMENDYTALRQELLKSGEFATPPQQGGMVGDTDDLIQKLQNMGSKK